MLDDSVRHVHYLDLEDTAPQSVAKYWLHIANNKIGEPIRIPLLVARGRSDGHVLGMTAAVHGNELNGISVIQKFFAELDPRELVGWVVGVLAVNVPGVLQERREFNDGTDLNRIAPGRANGTTAQVYLHRFLDRIISKFNFHVDLHTASFGRINSYYVRADMNDPDTARLARLQTPAIIVHNSPNDSTLRGAASARGVKSITVELCDPHVFQGSVVDDAYFGIRNILADLGMMEGGIKCPLVDTYVCKSSYWLYTDEGGILLVYPQVTDLVAKGDLIAEVRTVFGEVTKRYFAPEAGIVVGKSTNPLNQTGSRILHLGLEPQAVPCIERRPG